MRHIIMAAALAAALFGSFVCGYRLGHDRHPAVEKVRVARRPPVVGVGQGGIPLRPGDVVQVIDDTPVPQPITTSGP